MSSPPQTPTHRPVSSHRRHPSSLDMSHTTPSRRYSLNRRSSGYSPMTPRSSHEFDHSGHNFDGAGDGELGNLADELGDTWDEDEDAEEGEFGEDSELPHQEANGIGLAIDHDGSTGVNGLSHAGSVNGVRDSGVAMQSSSPSVESKSTLSPQTAAKPRKHQRQRSLYDGSDYGDDSDLEAHEGISAGLEKEIAAIESLARRVLEQNGSASDQVIRRVVEQLRDLGSQTSIENGATRLKTAHDALTTHLSHQSRTLLSLTANLSGPRAIIPDLDTIETLLPLISDTLEVLPHSSPDPGYALSQLRSQTQELLQHMGNVGDTLHMGRQITSNATRRLKSSKDQLAEWKRDQELLDQGMRYIEKGDWDRRLKEREAKHECGIVLQEFEEVCGNFRQRLCEGFGVASA